MKLRIGMMIIVGAGIGCSPTREGSRTSSARDPLTAEEISKTSATNAYEAVRMRRPMFLYTRGPKSFRATDTKGPMVYLNGMFYGEVPSLQNIPAESIAEIRFISDQDATIQFGTGHPNGVIMVTTKTGSGSVQ